MITFFDASALVKNYIDEEGSDTVRRLLTDTIPSASRLSAVEVASAFARRCREDSLSMEVRDRLLKDLQEDLSGLYVIELSPDVTVSAGALLRRYSLRSADAIQLASSLVLQRWMRRPVTFAAYDQRLLEAARQEGLAMIKDPPQA